MFEEYNQLYPTPPQLVRMMLEPFTRNPRINLRDWETARAWNLQEYADVLDPSAGKGDLLKAVKDQLRSDTRGYAIEIEPELRMILNGKGITVVETDLLAVEAFDRHYGLILANPPFAQGVTHALKLWELMQPGTDMCIVLNAETIRNAFSDERVLLLKIIEDHGWWEEAGQPFLDAKRPTDVECVLVYLRKLPSTTVDWEQAGLDEDAEQTAPNFADPNSLATRNTIATYVHAYQQAIAAQERMEQAETERKFWLKGISKPYEEGARTHDICDAADIKAGFWNKIFQATELGTRTTSRFQAEFRAHLAANKGVSFNERNVRGILQMFVDNAQAMLEQCIDDAFEMAIGYHEDNRLHTEGWKTNDSYRCARRVIVPYGPSYEKKFDRFDDQWTYTTKFTDIDRALCFITGLDIEKIQTSAHTVYRHVEAYNNTDKYSLRRPKYDRMLMSTFFNPIRIFKKGTLHFTFEDERLWMEFNIRAARHKAWLPNKKKSPPRRKRQGQEPLNDNDGRHFYNISGLYEWQDEAGDVHQLPVDQTVRDANEDDAFAAAVDWAILENIPDFHRRFKDDNVAKLAVGPATPQEALLLTEIDWTPYQRNSLALPAPEQAQLLMLEED